MNLYQKIQAIYNSLTVNNNQITNAPSANHRPATNASTLFFASTLCVGVYAIATDDWNRALPAALALTELCAMFYKTEVGQRLFIDNFRSANANNQEVITQPQL